jgi:hypothetical protein
MTEAPKTVKVLGNAPNWPKMVKYQNILVGESQSKNTTQEPTLKTETKVHVETNTAFIPKQVQFAAKPKLVRQCSDCQVIYINSHTCSTISDA